MNKLIKWLKNPGGVWLICIYLITIVFITGALIFVFCKADGILTVLSYIVYSVALIGLAYSVYTIVIYRKKIHLNIVMILKRNSFIREIMDSYGYRTIFGVALSLAASVVYGVINGVLGILSKSVWYGSLAAYYICLAFIRIGVLVRNKRSRDGGLVEYKKAGTYRNSGVVLLLLNTALSVAIAQMIFDGMGFIYGGIMIYVSATYSFTKIGISVYNFIKAQKQSDAVIEIARNISLVDAAVSILSLQTAMLVTYTQENIDISLANTLTGSAVSLLSYFMAIFMIVKGNKKINKIKSENINGQ